MKMVYKRVRGWTTGRSLPVSNVFEFPSGSAQKLRNSTNLSELQVVKETFYNKIFEKKAVCTLNSHRVACGYARKHYGMVAIPQGRFY